MKPLYQRAILATLCLCLPLALIAADEAGMWDKAQKKNNLAAYDEYVTTYPDGPHAQAAKQAAAKVGASEFGQAAKSCDPLYPRIAYYTLAGAASPTVNAAAVADGMDNARNCSFDRQLMAQQRFYAIDGLLAAHYAMETNFAGQLHPKTFIDTHAIMLPLEDQVIRDAYDEIVKCSDQNAWVDTPAAKQRACAAPYVQTQRRMGQAMGDHAKYDFKRIQEVNDPGYRLDMWERYRKFSKGEVMVEVAAAYKLDEIAKQARAAEKDPKVADKIETVAIRMAGAGKPTGGGFR